MRFLILSGISFLFLISCTVSKQSKNKKERILAISEIEIFQQHLSDEWTDPDTTPLKENEKENFQGIHFYPIDLKYRVNADFIEIKEGKTLPFPTSANKIKYFKEYGKVVFSLDSEQFELTLYQSDPPYEEDDDSLFLPFMDDTNGETSYGGGRYIDLSIYDIKKGKILIDFNQAYNPYCAYSDYYNCPIPPKNNYLETEIKAGVSYKQKW